MKITILVGLPGSGKTTLGSQLVKENGVFLDDFSKNYGLAYLAELVQKKTQNIVMADVFLCRKNDREKFQTWLEINAFEYTLDWVFFENYPEYCRENIKDRMAKGDTREVLGLLWDLSMQYQIPKEKQAITIHKTEG